MCISLHAFFYDKRNGELGDYLMLLTILFILMSASLHLLYSTYTSCNNNLFSLPTCLLLILSVWYFCCCHKLSHFSDLIILLYTLHITLSLQNTPIFATISTTLLISHIRKKQCCVKWNVSNTYGFQLKVSAQTEWFPQAQL